MSRLVRAVAGSLLALPASWAKPLLVGDLPLPGGKFVLGWKENISVPIHPGYASLSDLPELEGVIFITSFEATPFVGKNAIYRYDKKNGMQKLPGTEGMNWPNAMTIADRSFVGFGPTVIVGSGFLVPSHTTGAVWVLEALANPEVNKKPVKITKDKAGLKPDSGWFYHQGALVDMNGDGKMDVLTSRCEFGVWPWSRKQGELLWLEQPQSEPMQGPWKEHHLADGPDFLFCVQPGTKELALAAPEYINKQMVYYWMQDGVLKSRVLDAKSGPGFSCSWSDLDGDGRLELLATNHLNEDGSVYAYSFDGEDFGTAAVTRHVLATGFDAATRSQGTASPGDALAFRPSKADQGKPHIFLSGDNSNSIFVLSPASQEPGNFEYTKQEVAYLGADIGRPAIGDTDGDGFTDIYVPAYDNNVLVHYSFKTAAPATVVV